MRSLFGGADVAAVVKPVCVGPVVEAPEPECEAALLSCCVVLAAGAIVLRVGAGAVGGPPWVGLAFKVAVPWCEADLSSDCVLLAIGGLVLGTEAGVVGGPLCVGLVFKVAVPRRTAAMASDCALLRACALSSRCVLLVARAVGPEVSVEPVGVLICVGFEFWSPGP